MVHALPGSRPGGAELKVPNEGTSQSPGATWVECERFPILCHIRIRFQRHLPFRIHTSAVDTRPAPGFAHLQPPKHLDNWEASLWGRQDGKLVRKFPGTFPSNAC